MRAHALVCRVASAYTATVVALPLLASPLAARYPNQAASLVGRDVVAAAAEPATLLACQTLGLVQALNAFLLLGAWRDPQLMRMVFQVNAAGRLLFAGLATAYGLFYIDLAWLWVPVGIDIGVALLLWVVISR